MAGHLNIATRLFTALVVWYGDKCVLRPAYYCIQQVVNHHGPCYRVHLVANEGDPCRITGAAHPWKCSPHTRLTQALTMHAVMLIDTQCLTEAKQVPGGAKDMIQDMCSSYNLQGEAYQDKVMLTIVVVGASGDLAKKKIFPALFALYYQGLLPDHVQIVGYARSKATVEEFREKIMGTLACRIDRGCDPRQPKSSDQ
jgi:hypothetical protein